MITTEQAETAGRKGIVTVTVFLLLTAAAIILQIKYRGFDCPDRFVVGYGLDFNERYRNLSDIWAVDDVGALNTDPAALTSLLDGITPDSRAEV